MERGSTAADGLEIRCGCEVAKRPMRPVVVELIALDGSVELRAFRRGVAVDPDAFSGPASSNGFTPSRRFDIEVSAPSRRDAALAFRMM